MKTPLVSVIIPTYNRAKLLGRAVESVLDQTMPDHEIIIVDDGSTDDTHRTAAGFGRVIRYFRQANAGPGAARNRGIESARGEWIAFLDSDDRWMPEKLLIQLNETERLGALCSFHDSSHPACCGRPETPSWNRYIHETIREMEPIGTGTIPDPYTILRRCWHFFILSSMIIRRATLRRFGGFDPSFRTNQDIELYFRLAPFDPIGYIDRVLLEYFPGPNRSYEVASRLTGMLRRNGTSSKVCIYHDKLAVLRKTLEERRSVGDLERCTILETLLKTQLRTIASLYRQELRPIKALCAYIEYFGIQPARPVSGRIPDSIPGGSLLS